MRVLLIDDNKVGSSVLGDLMTRAGFEVMTAGDSWTGLEYLRQRHPDAIVWALQLSAGGAQELKRLIEHDPATKTIPFLFCAALPQREEQPADACPREPGPEHAEDLVARLRAALRRTRWDSPMPGVLAH